jgi:hypothetical protein
MIPGEAPVIVIELGLESMPRVRLICENDGEEARVVDWIRAHDGLAELVARALELAEEARAA